MYTVGDLIPLDNGLFTSFRLVYPAEYDLLFPGYEPINLDMSLLVKWGERIFSPQLYKALKVNDGVINLTQLSLLLGYRYLKNWLRINQALTADYDILTPTVSSYTMDTTTERHTEDDTTGTRATDIYGIDADVAQGRRDNVVSNTDNRQGDVDEAKHIVYNKRGLGTLTPNRLIEAELSLRRTALLNIVLTDCKEFMTLSIY